MALMLILLKTSQMNTDNYGSHEASQIQVSYKKKFRVIHIWFVHTRTDLDNL